MSSRESLAGWTGTFKRLDDMMGICACVRPAKKKNRPGRADRVTDRGGGVNAVEEGVPHRKANSANPEHAGCE